MPLMLETALIQMVVEENGYGQKGIADTIEILRKMRCEIGEEALKEWVQRSFVFLQSEEVLLGEMCESVEDSEDDNERIMVEEIGEQGNREEDMCSLRINGEIGDTPQRPQPNEQFCRELDLLMQKLPHENAQKAVILYCLRIACESEETVSETLSAIPQGESSYTLKIRGGCEGGGKGALIQTEKSATLSTLQDQTLFQPVYSIENHPQDSRVRIDDSGKVQTLAGRMGTGGGNVPMVMTPTCYTCDEKMGNTYVWEEQANTLAARDYKQPQAVCYSVDQGGGKSSCIVDEEKAPTLTTTHDGSPAVCYDPKAVDCRNGTESEINATLQSNMAHSLNGNNVVRCNYIVRRLTPMECERLQGYPDGWTDIGEWTDSNGKVHKTSDASRYKALGNSIALPPWKWVLKRICACYERDATMASLFDGIGGFPYLWEQINGKGSCLWASEIEEFPIAVTKKRIGGD